MLRMPSKRPSVVYILCSVLIVYVLYLSPWSPQNKAARDHHDNNLHSPPSNRRPITSDSSEEMTSPPEPWRHVTLPQHLRNVPQDDPALIRHIREEWIIPPSEEPLQLTRVAADNMEDFSQHEQPQMIHKLLGNMTDGFLIECGAGDGERHSNSLYFEVEHNWNGILIEPNPGFFASIRQRKRHMNLVNACLSTEPRPVMVNFTFGGISGGIYDLLPEKQRELRKISKKPRTEIQCLPLYSILSALGVNHVNYFSLDIEGAEVPVLKTLPLDHVIVDVFSIEKRVLGDPKATRDKEREITDILGKYGYKLASYVGFDMIMSRV